MVRRMWLVAGIVVIGVAGCTSESQRTGTQVGSGELGTPAAVTSSTPAPGGHNCPPPIGPSTDGHGDVHDMVVDYADVLQFDGHNYQSMDNTSVKQADLGASIGHVVCTLAGASHIDPGYRMQDGDATFAAAGSPIYSIKGTRPDRELAVEHDGVIHLYKARPAG